MNGDKMAIFEQYPEYAMRTNKKGERHPEKWVSGPSPLAMGLLAGGLGILGQPEDTSGWVTEGGGFDPTNMARGGLLGLQAYQRQHQNLQDQRKDYYTHLTSLQDQGIQNQRFKNEQDEFSREKKLRESMISGLPKLLETLEKTNIPGIQSRIPVLMAQAQSGDINGAYQSATNLNSQLAKVTKEKPEMITMGSGQKIMVQKDSGGGYSVISGQSFGKSPILGGNRGKAISLILKASRGEGGLTLESPEAIAAYEELKKPRYTTAFDKDSGKYFEKEIPGYAPPSIEALMGVTSTGSNRESSNQNTPVTIKKPIKFTESERKSAGYANRMQKAMYEMDGLMSKGYRPSRVVMEYVKMGAPEGGLGRAEKEVYRAQMSPDDRKYARAIQDWLRAKLRKESGAVIGVAEASEELEAFFNVLVPGAASSSNDIYETFRDSRITALESMIGESGPAWGRWQDLHFAKKPRSASEFYNNSPFQKREPTKAEKIKKRFKK